MSSKRHARVARRVIASLAVAISMAAAPAVHAAIIGGVTITGTRYVNGSPTQVRCTAAEGNSLDATAYGVRTFTLQNMSDCPIWDDTDIGDHFEFVGKEHHIVKNGVATATLSFSGVQVLPGIYGVDKAYGAVSAILKCAGPTCASEQGSITFSRTTVNNDKIIFVGTYKAGF